MPQRATVRKASVPLGLAFTLSLTATTCLAAPDRGSAERALMEGHVDEAVSMLNSVLSANPKDPQAHLLLCRAYYSEEAGDLAVAECEAALANGGGGSSTVHDWMGRAYGQKASHTLIGAYGLAKKVKIEFETAVAEDASSVDAANDLSEFYIGAPSLVGGDVQKALQLADRVQRTMPQAAHRMRGLVAEDRHEDDTAESEFKAAVGVGGKPNAWVDLAAFYQKRKRYDEALATLRKAEAADPAKDDSLVDMGSILLEMKRQYTEGVRLERTYITSGLKSDAGPVCRAHFLAGRMLEKSGDKSGARQEYQAALKLASKYEPAQKALDSL